MIVIVIFKIIISDDDKTNDDVIVSLLSVLGVLRSYWWVIEGLLRGH